MTDEYRALVIGLIRDNWAAEAANVSLSHHDAVLPLGLAPTMTDRAVLAAYWADECRHAVTFASLLDELDAAPSDDEYEAARPGELLRLPIESWAEFGLFQVFADSAGCVHLADYRDCTYEPLRRVAAEILRDEGRHARLGAHNLGVAMSDAAGRERAQEVLPTWYAAAMGLFGRKDRPSRRDAALVAHGLRAHSNDELREIYRRRVDATLRRAGLDLNGVVA